jgi:excisionase family DNA binding protein
MRMPTLSPAAAARKAGLSRRTIMRVIQIGELNATRDNRNAWRIRPEDLDAWLASREPAETRGPGPTHAHPDAHLVGELRARIEGLEARLADRDAQLADLRADRDAWREQAQRHAGGFWTWVRGLGR